MARKAPPLLPLQYGGGGGQTLLPQTHVKVTET